MEVPKVLIADSISQRGIEELAASAALEVVVRTGLSETQLVQLIPEFSAIVVRSQTKVTARDLASRRRACAWSVARAWASITSMSRPPRGAA